MSDTPLWDDNTLLTSEAVVNAHMNRGRGLTGVNSYDRELGQSVNDFLFGRVQETGAACWYDACCGEGRALREAAEQYAFWPWGNKVTLLGADLIGPFASHAFERLHLEATDVLKYSPPQPPDLCTCVHGIHYLGDKLGFLEHVYAHLAPSGTFLGHMDPYDLRLPSNVSWNILFDRIKMRGIPIRFRSNRLRITRIQGNSSLGFGLTYRGSFPSPTANYSGMRGVISVYEETT